jgi:hypothetical protein
MVTTSVADVVRVREPLTPVIVNGYVPSTVLGAVEIVKLELAPDAGFGLNVAVAPAGKPVVEKVTAPVNPPVREMLTE